jgi:hypothetical protein
MNTYKVQTPDGKVLEFKSKVDNYTYAALTIQTHLGTDWVASLHSTFDLAQKTVNRWKKLQANGADYESFALVSIEKVGA